MGELMLDGNAIAGLLQEVFAVEMTTAIGTCGGCGAAGPVGAVHLYRGAGIVLRCPHCNNVLAKIVKNDSQVWIDFQGIRTQASIPLHLVAFDLLSGNEVRLSDGPAVDAVLAAAAIPGVLPPVRWRGQLLADGGIADNTPISHAVALSAQRIYVLPTQNPGDRGPPHPPRGRARRRGARDHPAHQRPPPGRPHPLRPAAELIVLPALNPQHIAPTDFGHAGQLITQALAAARTALTVGSAQPADGGHSPRRPSPRHRNH